MTLSRRSFLTACIASACAPAIVRAGSLMPVTPARYFFHFDGIHCDVDSLEAWRHGARVLRIRDGIAQGPHIFDERIKLNKTWSIIDEGDGVSRILESCRFYGQDYSGLVY